MTHRRLGILLSTVLGVAALAFVPTALAEDPGGPSGDGVTPVLVAGNPTCATLNADPKFGSVTSDFGFKVQDDANVPGLDPYNRTVPMDGTAPGTSLMNGAPADAVNTVTLASSDGVFLNWSATLGIDAVIVKASSLADAFVYVPEDSADTRLHGPINPQTNLPYGISHVELCYDYSLAASKTAAAKYTRTHTWTIAKDFDGTYSKFAGEPATTHGYKVSVDQTSTDSGWMVDGSITVKNPSPWPVSFLVSDSVGGTAASPSCSSNMLAPNDGAAGGPDETTCSYSAALGGPVDGINTATITSIATLPAIVDGATVTAGYAFGEPTTVVGEKEIHVTDSAGQAWTADGDASWEYTRAFACPTDTSQYVNGVYVAPDEVNTAEITETGQKDTATVKLSCYAPAVSKDATAQWKQQYDWKITKTAAPASHVGFAGDTFTSTYDVFVDRTVTDSGFNVSGTITIENPSGSPGSMTMDVADVVGGGFAATVDCDAVAEGDQTAVVVAAGAAEKCSYSVALPDNTSRVNTATATFNDIGFTATADVVFGEPIVEGDATVNVTDSVKGPLGPAGADKHFTYEQPFTCSSALSDYTSGKDSDTYPNAAKIDETGASADASVQVDCYVPSISKTATGTYDEIHDWDVFKSGATAQKKFVGQSASFSWTVRVDETTHGENYLVTGDIVVKNPNPEDALTVALSDVLDDGSTATIGPCTGGTLVGNDLTVPAGGTAACDYSATPKGDLVDFADGLPGQVTMSVDYPESGDPAYFERVVISGDGALNGTYEGWCVDQDHTINQNTNYNANVYSSYESLPSGLVEHPENFDLVNWIINQDFVYKPAGGSLGTYTYGDVQRAIWELIDDSPFSTSGLNGWNQTRVNQIKAAAIANGEGFTPTCGDFVAVVLQPVGGQQPITIAQVTFASLGIDCAKSNAVTAVFNGIELPASAQILWTANKVNETATLDDTQNPAWPTTVSADQTFTYNDPQGYTCPVDPAAYAGDGIAPVYTDNNTASLTYTTGSRSATASTSVTCYGPIVSKTASAAWNKKYDWTITKTADPAHHAGFAGATFTSTYDVFVDQTVTDYGFKASGAITVKNPSGSPGNMTVNVTDTVGGGFPATVDCDPATAGDQTSLVVAANSTKTCTYTVDLPDNTNRVNTATGKLNNIGFPATANVVFGAPSIEGSPTVNVTDNVQGWLGSAGEDKHFTYEQPFSCSSTASDYTDYADSDVYGNTATIDETGLSDDARVTVDCFIPEISKIASGTYDERHDWDVTKTVSPVSQSAFAGETVAYDWTVDVKEQTFEEKFVASGTITVANHSPFEAMTVELSDALDDGTAAAIGACTGDADLGDGLTVAAGGTSVCDYSAAPHNDDAAEAPRSNTATAVLNGLAYSASDPIEWTANVIHASATLVDDQNPLFPLTITEGGTWSYPEQYTCSTDKSAYDATTHKYAFGESNTATLKSGDFADSSTASTGVDCYVPSISKDASGKYDEIHDWEVFKTATAAQKKFAGQSASFNWTVRVDETTHGENYLVNGDIVVTNPNPEDVLTVALSDALDDGSIPAIGPCTGGDLNGSNLTVPAGGTATCGYTVTPKGNLAAFAAALPATVTINSANPGPDSYWLTTVKNDGALNGTYESWCLDIDRTMNPNTDYTATVYSSYEAYPTSLIEKYYNMDLVNWVINQGFVGKPATPLAGTYTYGDVQRAIWELIEDNPSASTAGLGSWSQARVDQIKAAAIANGEGFTPTCGDFIAVLLVPTGGQQPISIAQVTFASLGIDCAKSNAVTAVFNGIEFPASAQILWTANKVNETATLDDTQNAAWPLTVSADQTFTYNDPQGYSCPVDPAAYAGDGIAPAYTDTNTALLTYATGSKSATASTSVTCYGPIVSKTASTEWKKKYDWTITKTADPASHVGFAGDTFESAYDVFVDQTITEYGFKASGAITVKNPSGSPGNMTVNLADTVGGGFPAAVDCDPATAGDQTSLVVAANSTKTCTYTAGLPDNTNRVNTATGTFNNIGFPATANVVFGAPIVEGFPTIDVTDNVQGWLGTAGEDKHFTYKQPFSCSTILSDYTTYADSDLYPNTARITGGPSDDASVKVDCYWPADAKVVKATVEGPEEIGQLPFSFELYDPAGTKVETKTLNAAGEAAFDAELKPEGIWKIVEILPAGWVNTNSSLECTFTVDYWTDAGKTFTCTFDNTELSRLKLLKWTQGLPDPAKDWKFSVWAGANSFGVGNAISNGSTKGDLDGVLDFGNVDLSKLQAYTLCEQGVPAGWTSFWQVDSNGDGAIDMNDAVLVPYNPNASDNPPEDLGNRCVNFGAGTGIDLLSAGKTLLFMVNNTYPGGDPRTPGYWKNWNRATGGGQADNADRNGGYMSGFWLLENVLDPAVGGGIVWDDILSDGFLFPIQKAAVAVDILDQREIGGEDVPGDGPKHSSDAAYTLAMHLLAAQLNFGASARTCDAAFDAALAGEQLLDKYDFGGTGSYLLNNDRRVKSDFDLALSLAKTLDEYNNGELCSGPAVSFVSPTDGDTVAGSQTIEVNAMDQVPVNMVEFFVNGTKIGVDTVKSDGWSIVWDSTSVEDGSRTLSAVATNSLNQAGSGDVTITVDNVLDAVLPKVHVGGLTATTTKGKAGKWNATATVTIHDAGHAGLGGAAVSLMWGDGVSATCTTGGDGTCGIARTNIGATVTSLTLEVTNVTLSGSDYTPALNEVTSVGVNKPQ